METPNTEELEKIKEDICDNYCKHPLFDTGEELKAHCETCPLRRL